MEEAHNVGSGNRRVIWDYIEVLAVLAAITALGLLIPLNYHALGYIFLLAIIAVSLRIRRWPALVGAVSGSLAWNFFFVPPRFSFSILHLEDSLLLSCYLIVALIGSQLKALRSADDRARLLAESERMHQTILDSVSHELKTPIAVFRSALEQLRTDDQDLRECLVTEISIAAARLERLVENLLNQTRLESGVLRPRLDWCDADDLIAAARRAVGSRLDDRPITVDIPPSFPIFRADAAMMEQAIANLLLNAAVHTPAPGSIHLEVGVSRDASKVLIEVSDDGPGVPEGIRERIFEKFNRGPGAAAGGLGLGLSIVRGFMRAQGGDVASDFPPKGGSRFTLSLPLTAHEIVPNG